MLIPRAEPLPQAEHYAQAFSDVNQEMQTQGGLRFYLANRALMVTLDETLAAQDKRLAFYGLRFVDSSLDFDDEASYDACYAYINGYMVARIEIEPSFDDELRQLLEGGEIAKCQAPSYTQTFRFRLRRIINCSIPTMKMLWQIFKIAITPRLAHPK